MVLAPASVWATKRWPVEQWSRLADAMADRWPDLPAVLLGGTSDRPLLEAVRSHCTKADPLVCAGDLSLLSSAALMARATSVVSNDSAPLHMAGAVGCPVVGVFCSTTPSLGFGVLPDDRESGRGENVEVSVEELDCKPCGVHGQRRCPEGHFRCGTSLSVTKVMNAVQRVADLS